MDILKNLMEGDDVVKWSPYRYDEIDTIDVSKEHLKMIYEYVIKKCMDPELWTIKSAAHEHLFFNGQPDPDYIDHNGEANHDDYHDVESISHRHIIPNIAKFKEQKVTLSKEEPGVGDIVQQLMIRSPGMKQIERSAAEQGSTRDNILLLRNTIMLELGGVDVNQNNARSRDVFKIFPKNIKSVLTGRLRNQLPQLMLQHPEHKKKMAQDLHDKYTIEVEHQQKKHNTLKHQLKIKKDRLKELKQHLKD
jgi:hypothetical protein